MLFGAGAVLIGGAAPLGKEKAGYFFVGDHGRLTEVSAAGYWYSRAHAVSQVVTFPLAIVAAIGLRRSRE